MEVFSSNYLIAKPKLTLSAKVDWNYADLPDQGVKGAIEDIAAWKGADCRSVSQFQGFLPSGARSYLCVLNAPIDTPAGQCSAIKIKAIGNTDPFSPHPPLTERYGIDPNVMVVREDGQISVRRTYRPPNFGKTYKSAINENSFMQTANRKGLPGPFSLGVGEYPDLMFEGNTFGFNIMAVKSALTDIVRLSGIFQVQDQELSLEDYLAEVVQRYFPRIATLNDLERMFYAAGKAQREYNDNGLIPNDSHTGNFAVTEEADIEPRDFGNGKIKDSLTTHQIASYQLLDLNRFIFSTFILRAWQTGEAFLSRAHPVSAYLEGYFGLEIFRRHQKDIGNPETMIRALNRPSKNQDKDRFLSSMDIMRNSWRTLFGPMEEVLGLQGIEYPLSPQERLDRFIMIFRDFFQNQGRNV